MSEHESIEWHKGFQMGLYSGISNEQERIIKLLENTQQNSSFMKAMSELQDKTADGSDVVEMWLIVSEYAKYTDDLIARIKGETK